MSLSGLQYTPTFSDQFWLEYSTLTPRHRVGQQTTNVIQVQNNSQASCRTAANLVATGSLKSGSSNNDYIQLKTQNAQNQMHTNAHHHIQNKQQSQIKIMKNTCAESREQSNHQFWPALGKPKEGSPQKYGNFQWRKHD